MKRFVFRNSALIAALLTVGGLVSTCRSPSAPAREVQVTSAPHGHILTNTGVWTPDSRWIVYDIRSDPAGSVFDGNRIEKVNVETKQVEVLYESRNGACCGVSPNGGWIAYVRPVRGPSGQVHNQVFVARPAILPENAVQ